MTLTYPYSNEPKERFKQLGTTVAPIDQVVPGMDKAQLRRLLGKLLPPATDTHFLRDDTRLTGFVAMRASVGGWANSSLSRAVKVSEVKSG